MPKPARPSDVRIETARGEDLKAVPLLALAAVNDDRARKRGSPKLGVRTQSSAPALSREHILVRATALAKIEPLGKISMVRLARELGVAPALIHYYIGSRDDLISGVANRYFKERVSRLQPLTDNWKKDLQREAAQSYKTGVEYGGVLRYMMSHNRFRVFQQVSVGETGY